MKLHPLSIPYRIVQSATGLVPLLFFVAFVVDQVRGGLLGPLFAGLLSIGILAAIGWQLAYYRRFEYELTFDTFDIRSGVISRRNREIPLRRVQNVDISRNVAQRLLGIAEVRIETAGGSETEASLRYVGYVEAKRLQNTLRARSREVTEGEPGVAEDTPPAEHLLYGITSSDLFVLSVASFDLRVASFLSIVLSITAPSVLIDVIFGLPVDPLVVLAGVLAFVVIASAVASGASAVVNNYGFRLSRSDDELRYERGLIRRYDGSVPTDKVQTLVVHENVLKRLFGYATLTVQTAGYAPGRGGGETTSAVPIARSERTWRIARSIEPFQMPTFSRPAKQARVRYTIRYFTLSLLLVAVGYGVTLTTDVAYAWYLLALGIPLSPVAAHLKWNSRGYAVGDEYVLTRSGFWNRTTHVVPYYRVQTVIENRTIIQRRWRIGTVEIDTAGTGGLVDANPRAYDLDERDANRLLDLVADRLQLMRARRANQRP